MKLRAVVLAFMMAAGSAAAAPSSADSKRAAQSFAIGKSAFARGDFPAAGAAFEQAAFYAPHPAPLLNAAEAWELAGDPVRAARICDRVLEMKDLEASFRQTAADQLARLIKNRVATIEIRAGEGGETTVDDEHDLGRKVRVKPGSHTVSARYPTGENRTESVSLRAGDTKEVDVTSRGLTVEKPRATEPSARRMPSEGPPPVTWVFFGAGAIAAGGTAVFGVRTLDARDAFNADPNRTTLDDFNAARLTTNIFLSVAAACAVTGAILWMVRN